MIFTRAEAALDTESEAPVGADVRAARAIRMLGRSTQGSIERGRKDLRGQLAAMRELAWRLGWLDLSVDPRLRPGEQNALRAIDVLIEHGYVHINGSWTTPRTGPGFRGPVTNHTVQGGRRDPPQRRRTPPSSSAPGLDV